VLPASRFLRLAVVAAIPVVAVAVAGVVLAAVTWDRRRDYERAAGLCVHCGYDLTTNASGRCPECGAKVRPVAAGAPRA